MDRHDPYSHDVSESLDGWGKPLASEDSTNCVDVAEFPNGDIWVGDTKRPDLDYLAFNQAERIAVLLEIALGKDPRFHLGENVRLAVLKALETGDTSIAFDAARTEITSLA
ncbi:hypothetical protein P3T36_007513 [Kitasatospora sp. MAP12-15]|uniref:DUF397 domain-containing protein n=1 Tax=unclassified Kitasatospora TaxID=2633591 RepID=UPI00247549AE|nr:DUF397 domain-containing protein [Kitasatospora sp. MAP12-44]MDH6113729.1 hypothetical protein [Kitasatospora sp. MAP12-44]